MGQKTHPIGFRVGVTKDWSARWFSPNSKGYAKLAVQDYKIRQCAHRMYDRESGIARIEIERTSESVIVSIHTARPGVIIGRAGKRVEELKKELEKVTQDKVRLNIQELRQAEKDAVIVSQSIAEQLERRVSFRRAVNSTVQRTMQAGAEGIKVTVSGRLGGADIARTETQREGRVPLHTLRADISFHCAEAHTTYGVIGIKVWIYKGRAAMASETELNRTGPFRGVLDTLGRSPTDLDGDTDTAEGDTSATT